MTSATTSPKDKAMNPRPAYSSDPLPRASAATTAPGPKNASKAVPRSSASVRRSNEPFMAVPFPKGRMSGSDQQPDPRACGVALETKTTNGFGCGSSGGTSGGSGNGAVEVAG